jgi:hypothetical protein
LDCPPSRNLAHFRETSLYREHRYIGNNSSWFVHFWEPWLRNNANTSGLSTFEKYCLGNNISWLTDLRKRGQESNVHVSLLPAVGGEMHGHNLWQ